jgi:hypothetical protein
LKTLYDIRKGIARIEMTKQGERTKAAKKSSRWRLPDSVTDLPTGVQKSYFMLSEAERCPERRSGEISARSV